MADIFTDSPSVYPQGTFYAELDARLAAVESVLGTGVGSLPANSVGTINIADKAVTGSKIADDTITAAQIAANAVTASELADNSVDTASIQSQVVTKDKLALSLFASNADTSSGTATDRFVTPASLADRLSKRYGFRAKQTTAAALGTSTANTKLIYNVVDLDTTGLYDATNSNITPGAGLWLISNTLEMTNSVAGTITAYIYVNGAPVASNTQSYTAAQTVQAVVTVPLLLSAGDVVECYCQGTSTSGTKSVTLNSRVWGVRIHQ